MSNIPMLPMQNLYNVYRFVFRISKAEENLSYNTIYIKVNFVNPVASYYYLPPPQYPDRGIQEH